MKTFNASETDEVFNFLAVKIQEADRILGARSYMLIGSYVRDIHLIQAGKKSPRGTQDLDLSIFVEDIQKLESTLNAFGPARGIVTRRSLRGTPVDIIPFGSIAPDGTLEYGDSRWELRGLRESYEHSELFTVGEESAKIPKIEAMIGLKLIAWGERRFPTDSTDFYHLLDAAVQNGINDWLWSQVVWDNEKLIEQYQGLPDLLAAFETGRSLACIFRGDALERCREIIGDGELKAAFVCQALRETKELFDERERMVYAFCDGVCAAEES